MARRRPLSLIALQIESRSPRLGVATDGEVRELDTPLDYRSRPRALRVLVPRQEAA